MAINHYPISIFAAVILATSNASAQSIEFGGSKENKNPNSRTEVHLDSGMWTVFESQKFAQEMRLSTPHSASLWSLQNIKTRIDDKGEIIQFSDETSSQDVQQFEVLPRGFSGTSAELHKIKQQFSSYKPTSTWLKPGKIYLRKNLEKPEAWKPTLSDKP